MIIFYGSKETVIATEELQHAVCPDCGQHGLTCVVFSKHAHLFWIPIFPLYKRKEIFCPHCELTYTPDQLQDVDRSEVSNISSKTPLWKFTGLALIILLMGWALVEHQIEKNKVDRYLNTPNLYDVYWVKMESGKYSTMRIEITENDSIYFSDNQYYVSNHSKIKEIDKDESYDTEELLVFSRSDLKEFREERIIYNIVRKKN